jgi:hypothetical protein
MSSGVNHFNTVTLPQQTFLIGSSTPVLYRSSTRTSSWQTSLIDFSTSLSADGLKGVIDQA